MKKPPRGRLSIEHLMEDLKFVVLEKNEFENRDLQSIVKFLEFSACHDQDTEKINQYYSLEKFSPKRKLSN